MLYLIGLGLELKSISEEGLEVVGKCDKVCLESYTVDFPYSLKDLKGFLGVEIELADRDKVESSDLVEESKERDIALLVYGAPLVATTHVSLIQDARNSGVGYKVFQNASIFDAVAETGLQIYKFGKTASMPQWKESYEPESFMDVVKQNNSIGAHSLILCDIRMPVSQALEQLRKASESYGVKLDNVVVCQSLGTENSKIFYGSLEGLEKKEVENPFCIIIPGSLHEMEKNFLESFSV